MRGKAKNGYLSVNAIAGSYVVLLGIDVVSGSQSGLLGFAIKRTDHTENEEYWLNGFKTFEATDPDVTPSSLVSTLEHPIQGFLWGDYTAKPNHSYTYTVVAMKGSPKNLVQDDTVAVDITTEDEVKGTMPSGSTAALQARRPMPASLKMPDLIRCRITKPSKPSSGFPADWKKQCWPSSPRRREIISLCAPPYMNSNINRS